MNGCTSCIPSGPPVVLKDCKVKDPGDVPFGIVTCIHESLIHREMVDHISQSIVAEILRMFCLFVICMLSLWNEVIDLLT